MMGRLQLARVRVEREQLPMLSSRLTNLLKEHVQDLDVHMIKAIVYCCWYTRALRAKTLITREEVVLLLVDTVKPYRYHRVGIIVHRNCLLWSCC